MSLNPPWVLVEWNCRVSSPDVEVGHFLSELKKDHNPDSIHLSEARTHFHTIQEWCKANGYTQYQLPPGAPVKSTDAKGQPIELVNELGDEAILLKNSWVPHVKKARFPKMHDEWEDMEYKKFHTPRQSVSLILDHVYSKTLGLRSDHAPTHGIAGPNKKAWLEFMVRTKFWALLHPLSVRLAAGDYNQNIVQVTTWMGKRFSVTGFGIDLLLSRGAKKVEHTLLDKGPSDHHAQLFTVWF